MQAVIKRAAAKAGIEIELKTVTPSSFYSSDPANPDTSHFYADLQLMVYVMGPPAPHACLHVLGDRVEGEQPAEVQCGARHRSTGFDAYSSVLHRSSVTGNTANAGGGIYLCLEGQVAADRFSTPCHSILTLQRTTVSDNTPDNIFPW